MRILNAALLVLLTTSVSVSAAVTVTFEKIARTGDAVPGRESLPNVVFSGRALQRFSEGVFSRPTINDGGEVVFDARSTDLNNFNLNSAIGIYAKTPGQALRVLVDTTVDGLGNGVFPVPGRSADTRFSSFKPPLLNNRGDVVFWATFGSPTSGSGQGFFATTTSGGSIVKIVNSLDDDVPGFPGQKFNAGFAFGGTFQRFLLISLNDVGQVVFDGEFRRPGQRFQERGYYGSTVAGGSLTRIADTTFSVTPVGESGPFIELSTSTLPAMNNAGDIIFQGGLRIGPSFVRGIWTAPVDGSSGPVTLARRGLVSPPLSDGVVRAWFSLWGGHDINDAGDFIFQHTFTSGFGGTNALFAGNVATPSNPFDLIFDNLPGGFAVPGRAGSNFQGSGIAAINESGQMGFFARDDTPGANAQGVYAADLVGTPFELVADNNVDIPPPGRVSPAAINDFKGKSAAINDSGNMVITPTGINEEADDAVFGAYFYDTCTGSLERIVDDTTSEPVPPAGLGDVFVGPGCAGFPCERFVSIWDGFETRAGHYRSINNSDDVGLLVAFSTFNVGVYIAHIDAGSGGDLRITCPADVTLECSVADSSAAATGDPRVCSDNAVTVSSSDATQPSCGTTETITRTWTAVDTVTNESVSCVQTIAVVDTVAPDLLGIPADASVACDSFPPPATPTVSDDCDGAPALVLDEVETPGSCDGEFMLTRTWTATDACGNSTIRCQVLTVGADQTAPLLTVPADVTVECGDGTDPASTGEAGTLADCNGLAAVTFSDVTAAGTCGGAQVITRTWTATDFCGNSASGDQIITVVDTTQPALMLPADVTVECDADSSSAATGMATATDACSGAVAVSSSDAVEPGTCPQGSIIRRTWSATDACGNMVSADQIITVTDTAAPVVTPPTDAIVECDADNSPAATGMASASDNCDDNPGLSFVDSTTTGACANESSITRDWSAADGCGNVGSASQIISIVDTTAPIISNLDGTPLLVPIGDLVGFTATFADNCNGPLSATWNLGDGTVVVTDPATSPTSVSHAYAAQDIYTVTVTIADGCGNSTTDQIVVVAYDPNNGFTTGGGWFVPDGESFIDGVAVTDIVSKASFGFVVKYKKGSDTPNGNLEFVYKAGDIDLHSLDMNWMVITSATKVRFKGLATINGQGEFTFKVTGEDNGEPGTNDTFKIEIWTGVVDTENGPPTPKHQAKGVLGGGNIKIHK